MTQIQISLGYRILSLNWNYQITIEENSLKIFQNILPYSEMREEPKLVIGIFWDKIIFKTINQNKFYIPGIKKNKAENSFDEFIKVIKRYHLKRIDPIYQQVKESLEELEGIFSTDKYVRYSEIERWKNENKELKEIANDDFAFKFLSKEKKKIIEDFLLIFSSKIDHIREYQNQKFLSKELQNYKEYFDTVENNPLTEKQRLACVVNEDNNLILASAGSGKTSVIIAKAGYLVQSGLALPHEILILAYGKKASEETNERIKNKLSNAEGIRASTFHKLGLDIVGESTNRKPRVSKLQEDPAEFYKLINTIIDDLIQEDSTYSSKIVNYFITHLIPYKDEFDYQQQGDYFSDLKENDVSSIKSKVEFKAKRERRISLKQEQLKSFEEVVIADFLFVNNINYIYEHPYEVDTESADKAQYQPDFYLPDYGIYIEHFGIGKNNKTAPFVDEVKYKESMEWKRALHRENETKLIETYSYEMREGTLTESLSIKLEKYHVKLNPLSFRELLTLLNDIGEEKRASKFIKTIVTFLDLFKQSGHSFETLRNNADKHQQKPRCHAFLDIFEAILVQYTNELSQSNTVDFNDMIIKATKLIQGGVYKPSFKHILVDEFQDISAIRSDLLRALVNKGSNTVLSCVGDDWQSIYRFSGADIEYIGNFDKYFGYTEKILLDKTFRYNDKLNDFSETFITQNPSQIKKEVTSHKSISTNAITLVEYHEDIDTAIKVCVDSIQKMHPESAIIYILGRYGFSKPVFLQKMAKNYPEYTFLFSTIHGSKGKEADFVIVVDVNHDLYGFPSRIEDEPLFDLVLPNSESYEYAEERRLFYVAVTRTKQHSFILFDSARPSVFIEEIKSEGKNGKYKFNQVKTEGVKSMPKDFGTCSSCKTGKIVMRVMPDGRFFFGCGYYPFCKNNPRTCNACNKYPLIKENYYFYCQNHECGNMVMSCEKCLDGVMEEREGRFGKFLGCSNYSNGKVKCKNTQNY